MHLYSVIIPVYNRPDEVRDLLRSLVCQNNRKFEVIIVEDGSAKDCRTIVEDFSVELPIKYLWQPNSGPGPARNAGAHEAGGEWLIFFDSDCIIPPNYFVELDEALKKIQFDAYGGPDKAHKDFSKIQKAIDYSMTSFLTTGGIRGGQQSFEKFKPRSFNMGMKRSLFDQVGGFSPLRFGEDIDMSLKLEKAGAKSVLVAGAFVYHKRRVSFKTFFKQVFNSGVARIILNKLHPKSLRIVHLLPSAFVLFHVILCFMVIIKPVLAYILLLFPVIIFLDSSFKTKNPITGVLAIISSYVQLTGYGVGFLKAWCQHYVLKKEINYAFRDNFYK
ncbi:Glycosyltransferase [Fulvivirga imtechensis AK7]|uniref:Glycosyltransferase n=1 Tax=Fulvivirga imtechensis AK7 TaxID=1237149 RepID=L8JN09_9BACT|nr:glycosyltransferase [Fulvivirga imtechensis]ELR68909.1 Glycosyltransferase [Fulvivirga imtechensis AK7]